MASRVWIVVQPRGGVVPRQAWEAVAAGQRLAAALGGPAEKAEKAEAIVVGSGVTDAAAEVGRCDLAAVHVADHARLATYTPGVTIGALAPALRAARPDFVVFPHSYQTVDFLARLAEATGAGLLPEVTGFSAAPADAGGLVWTRPILGGKMEAKVKVKGEGMVLLSVQSGAFAADSRAAGSAPLAPPTPIMALALDEAALVADREVLGYEEVGGDTVDLTKADIIVAVGRGVGGADKMGPVEELAKALGADIGASRPVIDNGWLPRDRQIGSSGATVAPKLYIAAGISGAIQHLVGMKGSSVIVAINKDPGAPIFAVADYGIVGDLHEILPALTEAVRAARG